MERKDEPSPRQACYFSVPRGPQSTHITSHLPTTQRELSNLLPICCSRPQPDPNKKHHILLLLFHLPLVWPDLASCQINIPIPWKPDKLSFSAVNLPSCPQLPGSVQSQWQPPPLPHPGARKYKHSGWPDSHGNSVGRSETLQGVRDFTSLRARMSRVCRRRATDFPLS